MKCEFCGGETKQKYVKRQHWLNNKLYIVEDIQAEVCTECGERYRPGIQSLRINVIFGKKWRFNQKPE